ncbi:hypothetical protein HD806DRAFT_551441 [Xylariaceae sp. AK1471]|nr:hypothetical protein HD806DRAFT_551441 [Xylariaceae sp. AK1471]
MGTESLLSKRSLSNGIQGSLPDNQWQLEVEHWYQIALAGYQKIYLDGASGPPPSYPEEYIQRRANPEQHKLCHNQKAVSTAHASFCVFGLAFLLIGGLLIIALAILLEPIARFVQIRAKLDQYSRLEWTDADKTIPKTEAQISLAALDISDLAHPKLLPEVPKEEASLPSDLPSSQTDAPVEERTSTAPDTNDSENSAPVVADICHSIIVTTSDYTLEPLAIQ